MEERIKQVAFANHKIKEDYLKLQKGSFEEQKLFESISIAISDLKKNPLCGIRIKSKLFPKDYKKRYELTNLWKYNLPNGWRLICTLLGDKEKIVSMIIEWMKHKNYDRRFGY